MDKQLISVVIIMTLMFVLEGLYPFFRKREKRLKHTGINVLFGIGNGILMTLLFAGLVAGVVSWSLSKGIGGLRLMPGPWYINAILAFILFDIWMYWWHRWNHEIKFLWNFHSMHHTDLEMDASTALRFHPGEKILSGVTRLLVIPVLGMKLIHFAFYNIVLSPIILFHHSNIAIPEPIDKTLRYVIVTPNMHRVHHSRYRPETDSNYASVFSVWDRIFGTYKEIDTKKIVFGLEKMRQPKWQTVKGMLFTPLCTAGMIKE